jgi:K+-dependent Na+/Ca+ exchanger-like protein
MIVVHILILLASFYALGVICDKYFIPALDKIAKKLAMPSDVAGATLMAVGSSAPELFIALFAVFVPAESGEVGGHGEIGVGTIIGSALFNLLVISGAVAVVRTAVINWKPVIRDLGFYMLSVAVLIVAFMDGTILWWEAGIFVALYGIYVWVVMKWKHWVKYEPEVEEQVEEEEEKKTIVSVLFNLLFPFKHYMFRFLMSIALIAFLSWALVESAIGVAHVFNIPEAIIALTVLAAGTSIPDLISSIIVSKKGKGDMGISNAIGSNVFDVLIGLGLPWMVFLALYNKPIHVGNDTLFMSSLILMGSIVLMLLIFLVSKWKLGKFAGYSLIGVYLLYISYELVKYYSSLA